MKAVLPSIYCAVLVLCLLPACRGALLTPFLPAPTAMSRVDYAFMHSGTGCLSLDIQPSCGAQISSPTQTFTLTFSGYDSAMWCATAALARLDSEDL